MSIGELTVKKLMTVEEFLELPEDGIDRDLIDGEVREWGEEVTLHNPDHGEAEALFTHILCGWNETRPRPRGKVVGGDTKFRLRRHPDVFVGADVAYVSPEMVASLPRKRRFFEVPPVLAIEILSPSDKHERVVEKVGKYLEAGTVVWVADPDFRIVTIHRPGEPAVPFGESCELDAEAYLPGFRVVVSRFFDT